MHACMCVCMSIRRVPVIRRPDLTMTPKRPQTRASARGPTITARPVDRQTHVPRTLFQRPLGVSDFRKSSIGVGSSLDAPPGAAAASLLEGGGPIVVGTAWFNQGVCVCVRGGLLSKAWGRAAQREDIWALASPTPAVASLQRRCSAFLLLPRTLTLTIQRGAHKNYRHTVVTQTGPGACAALRWGCEGSRLDCCWA